MRNSAVTILLAYACLLLLSSSCHGASLRTTLISSQQQSRKLTTSLPLLRAQGLHWVRDDDSSQVILKGTNLGNWLLQEPWMMGQSSQWDQCSLEDTLETRFGATEKERLMDLFHDNWITDRDFDILQDFDFNVLRLPLLWNLMEDEDNPMTLRSDAWHYVDATIAKAASRGMYTILDLHGVVGGQTDKDHTGCSGQNQYWDNTSYQERTKWLWQQIALRYKDNSNVVRSF